MSLAYIMGLEVDNNDIDELVESTAKAGHRTAFRIVMTQLEVVEEESLSVEKDEETAKQQS